MTEFDIQRRHIEIEVHNLLRRNEGKRGLEPLQTSFKTALIIAEDEIKDHPIDGLQQVRTPNDK